MLIGERLLLIGAFRAFNSTAPAYEYEEFLLMLFETGNLVNFEAELLAWYIKAPTESLLI